MSASDNEKRRQFFGGAGEVRLAGDGTVDEVVAKPVDVHLEQMGHDHWWMGLSTGANDGWSVNVSFTVVDGGINVSVEDVGIEGTGIAVGFVKDDEEDELPTVGHTSMEGPLCSKLLARELIAAARREAEEARAECERLRLSRGALTLALQRAVDFVPVPEEAVRAADAQRVICDALREHGGAA